MQFTIVLSSLLLALTSLVVGAPVALAPSAITSSHPLHWWEHGPGPVGLPYETPDQHLSLIHI